MSILRAKTLDLKITRPLTEQQKKNSQRNEKEALSNSAVVNAYPRRLVFEMTNVCNIHCKMCGRNAVEFQPTVFHKKWLELFEPIADKIEEVTLLGWGEPTLHKDFVDFLKWAHSHELRIFFCTNGTRLDSLMEDIFKYQVDLLTVSLDGAVAETNNSIRCGADFDKITANIRAITKRKKELGISYPHISTVMTLMQSNFREFPDYVRLAHTLGIQEVKGVYLTAFDSAMIEESLFDKRTEVEKVFKEAAEVGNQLGIDVKLPYLQGEDIAEDKAHKDCYVGWRDFFLGSDGYVRPCMSTSQKLFGINKYGTFDEMWNSDEMQEFRRKVNSNEMEDSCRNCYQASCANWNKKYAFIQEETNFAPKWEEGK